MADFQRHRRAPSSISSHPAQQIPNQPSAAGYGSQSNAVSEGSSGPALSSRTTLAHRQSLAAIGPPPSESLPALPPIPSPALSMQQNSGRAYQFPAQSPPAQQWSQSRNNISPVDARSPDYAPHPYSISANNSPESSRDRDRQRIGSLSGEPSYISNAGRPQYTPYRPGQATRHRSHDSASDPAEGRTHCTREMPSAEVLSSDSIPSSLQSSPQSSGRRPSQANGIHHHSMSTASTSSTAHTSSTQSRNYRSSSAATASSASGSLYSGSRNTRSPGQSTSAHSQSTTTTATSSSSKSVLTVALQKAQSAVLLDSANNVPAAVAAYQQSVRLLKEVMVRVEESAANWRAKEEEKLRSRPASGGVEGEAEIQQRLRREEKIAKRETARLEEGRRLKVIVRLSLHSMKWTTIDGILSASTTRTWSAFVCWRCHQLKLKLSQRRRQYLYQKDHLEHRQRQTLRVMPLYHLATCRRLLDRRKILDLRRASAEANSRISL